MTPEIYVGLSNKGQLAFQKRAINDAWLLIHIVADHFGISEVQLMSTSRKREVTVPRQVAMFFLCEMTMMPLIKIGKLFGQDHSTVIYGRDEVKDKVEIYPDFKREINAIRVKIRGIFAAQNN